MDDRFPTTTLPRYQYIQLSEMNANESKSICVLQWNSVTGGFWLATVEESVICGMNRYKERRVLQRMDTLSEKEVATIRDAYGWIFIGIFDSPEEASRFIMQIQNI